MPEATISPEGIKHHECQGLLGILFGHKFCARYDEHKEAGSPSAAVVATTCNAYDSSNDNLEDVLDALGRAYRDSSTTYVHDVCVRCGLIIHRPQK